MSLADKEYYRIQFNKRLKKLAEGEKDNGRYGQFVIEEVDKMVETEQERVKETGRY
jgi:hypothetical protein